MGAHIEKKSLPTFFYPIGSTYQPNEAMLAIGVQSLETLNTKLKKVDNPSEIIFDDFIIKPMSSFQKFLSDTARWISQ
jgi:hydroxyacylglutathione hydrolase